MKKMISALVIFFNLTTLCLLHLCAGVEIKFNPSNVEVEINKGKPVSLVIEGGKLTEYALVVFTYQEGGQKEASYHQEKEIIHPLPNITIHPKKKEISFLLSGKNAGQVYIGIESNYSFTNLNNTYLTVHVVHSRVLSVIITVIGWIYFAAWSISFYPQVVLNWGRRSVVGLSFDFLGYNLTGFLAYGLFNIGMYWIPVVKEEYFKHHPRGVNPVLLNDVVFTLHAIALTCITIFQCFIYERGGQRVSRLSTVILSVTWLFALVSLFVAVGGKITWLEYLYFFSYIKLGVTLIKYIPQAIMNCQRKSTLGWSIGNVLLDFTGGTFSLLQMFLLAYNNDDWTSLFGDPTKFGLGAFSMLFDVFFMIQHYCLYGNAQPYDLVPEEVHVDATPEARMKNASNYLTTSEDNADNEGSE